MKLPPGHSICKTCGYEATPPICTKCGSAAPSSKYVSYNATISELLSGIILLVVFVYMVIKVLICERYNHIDYVLCTALISYNVEPDFIVMIHNAFYLKNKDTVALAGLVYPRVAPIYLPEARADLFYEMGLLFKKEEA